MVDLTNAIQAAGQFKDPDPATRHVCDEEVQVEIEHMATQFGYRPSEQIVEPVRAFLSGHGVALTGKAGVGKTMLMQSLGVRIYAAVDIATYGIKNLGVWYEWTDGKNLCIDDLGSESTVSEFGAKNEILGAVIAHRAERQSGVTHVTSNLDAKDISARYGDRTLSRILGMCKAFRIEGTNRRGT